MDSPHMNWTDGTRRPQINKAMRRAHDAFDRAYYKSQTNEDLLRNILATTAALNDALRNVIDNERCG